MAASPAIMDRQTRAKTDAFGVPGRAGRADFLAADFKVASVTPDRLARSRMDMPCDTVAEMSDDMLLVLYANGDREASSLLTARLAKRLLGYAMRLLADRSKARM